MHRGQLLRRLLHSWLPSQRLPPEKTNGNFSSLSPWLNSTAPARDTVGLPLVRMARGHIPRRVPAAGLAPALLICISAVLPGLLRPPERPPGLGSFLFFALPRHHRLTPGARAHYSFKSCQLVSSAYRLIRREVIFKVPVGGLLDGLSPGAALFCGLGELCTSA